jgi:hypothetical protein
MRQKAWTPAKLRKQPEIFCCTLTMRTSRSARLLSKGTAKLCKKASTTACSLLRRSTGYVQLSVCIVLWPAAMDSAHVAERLLLEAAPPDTVLASRRLPAGAALGDLRRGLARLLLFFREEGQVPHQTDVVGRMLAAIVPNRTTERQGILNRSGCTFQSYVLTRKRVQ